jgi:hypothetical protein
MDHARAEIGPAQRLVLLLGEPLPLGRRESATGGQFQGFQIELRLLPETGIEKGADLEEAVDRTGDGRCGAAAGWRLDDQRVEPNVLRLLDPTVLEPALEQGLVAKASAAIASAGPRRVSAGAGRGRMLDHQRGQCATKGCRAAAQSERGDQDQPQPPLLPFDHDVHLISPDGRVGGDGSRLEPDLARRIPPSRESCFNCYSDRPAALWTEGMALL